MTRILLCRELGGGHGHVARLLPLAERLCAAGHIVVVAAPADEKASFVDAGFETRDTPSSPGPRFLQVREPGNFAELLMNFGGGDPELLAERTSAWRRLFADVAPQVVVSESAPFAVLAAQGLDIRVLSLGTGFFTPPDATPLPELPNRQTAYPDRLVASEALVREAFNTVLQQNGAPGLPHLARLFQRVDPLVLTTFAEFDHYGARDGVRYAGHWSRLPGGRTAAWPEGDGLRVFVYSRSIVLLDAVFGFLRRLGCAVLAYLPDADDGLFARYEGGRMRLSREPFDIEEIRDTADAAIVNGGHAAACDFLLAGVPLCVLPTKTEQVMVARRVEELGAGRCLLPATEADLEGGLGRFFRDRDALARGAEAFAARYRDDDADAELDRLVSDIGSPGAAS